MLKKISVIILIISFAGGCAKAPINVSPTNLYSLGNYPSSIDGLNSVLTTCYSALRDANMFGFNLLPKALASATHTANAPSYDGGWAEMGNTTFTTTNSYVLGVWQVCYAGIKNCNTTLQATDVYLSQYAQPGDQANVSLIRGQAYFLRAYYYFELENFFGEDNVPNASATDTLGVPIITAVPTSLAGSQQGRSSIKAVWNQIESDLNQAITLLHGQVWVGNDEGRASEWAAKALLGKAYVFTKDWTDAKTALLDVINNSGKTLMSYSKYRNAFIGISANEFNEESIFEINIDYAANGNYGVYGNAPNATSINGLIWSPYVLGNDGAENDAIALGYGNEQIHDQNLLRFGLNIGTYSLVANPGYNSAKPASPTNPVLIMDPAYKQKSLDVRSNMTADPRLFVNALEPWVDSAVNIPAASYVPGTVPTQGFIPVSRPSGIPNPNVYQWSFRKYAPIYCNVNSVPGGQADGANIYILRLADVFLLYAEACANTSDATDAVEYLNKVKRRAYGYPYNSPSPVDYASLSDQTSAANASDPVLGHNPLYYERWAELFNEGHWWFDICRWHLGASEAAFYVSALNAANNPLVFPDPSYAWPIPLSELNSNAKIVKQQNPGY